MRNPVSCWGSFRISGVARGLCLCLVVSLVPGAVFWGCSGPSQGVQPARGVAPSATSPVQTTIVADWDDLQAAVGFALSRTELVRVSVFRPTEDRVEFRLRSSRDEPGLLVATREDEWCGGDPVTMTLTCTVGRFGDPAREQQFLELVAERLGQLRGVEVAPIKR